MSDLLWPYYLWWCSCEKKYQALSACPTSTFAFQSGGAWEWGQFNYWIVLLPTYFWSWISTISGQNQISAHVSVSLVPRPRSQEPGNEANTILYTPRSQAIPASNFWLLTVQFSLACSMQNQRGSAIYLNCIFYFLSSSLTTATGFCRGIPLKQHVWRPTARL